MCPACLATAALIAAGATAAGGVTATLVKKLRPKDGVPADRHRTNPTTQVKGQDHESAENRGPE
jgi:hypothetical protein